MSCLTAVHRIPPVDLLNPGGVYFFRNYTFEVTHLRAVTSFVLRGLGFVLFIVGLLLLYGSLVLGGDLAIVAIIVVYIGFLIVYLQVYCGDNVHKRRRDYQATQDSCSQEPPQRPPQSVNVDNPPRYEELTDLQPDLFKVMLPTYEEVSRQNILPDHSSVASVPVHRPFLTTDSK